MTLTIRKVAVECRDIRLGYDGTEVLKNVSLRIEPGEFFALLGPSGSGKSTLLRLIAGFNRPQQGQLLVDGKDIGSVAPHARNIGMVFQSYALWPHLSVYDNVAFGLVERRRPRAEIARRVAEALETVGLQDYARRRPNQLSGGQQQRVALARTIVIEPQVLLLDEPLSNLDKNLRVQMRRELHALQRRLGITTIFVTHDQEEAMTTADRMAVLDQGVVQQVGTPTEIYDSPVNGFVAGFVGTMNMLQGRVRSRDDRALTLRIEGAGDLTLPLPDPVPEWASASAAASATLWASFRPHAVRLRAPQSPVSGYQRDRDEPLQWLEGTVQEREFSGSFTRYRIQVGSQSITADRGHVAGDAGFPGGSDIGIGISGADVRLLAG